MSWRRHHRVLATSVLLATPYSAGIRRVQGQDVVGDNAVDKLAPGLAWGLQVAKA